jgi:UDP-N-acetylglucosamine (GlcNAc):hydroxyproline polypeptide GlcNAc-transferase
MSGVPRIFVQIPAYKDNELSATLRDLYRKAASPDRLRTCVVWQHDPDESLPRDIRELPGLQIIDVDAAGSQGCNWARTIAQAQWDGEPFPLLLDSHHRFVKDWDELVLSMYRQLADAGVTKPLLTGYPARIPARCRARWPWKAPLHDGAVVARGRSPDASDELSHPVLDHAD